MCTHRIRITRVITYAPDRHVVAWETRSTAVRPTIRWTHDHWGELLPDELFELELFELLLLADELFELELFPEE